MNRLIRTAIVCVSLFGAASIASADLVATELAKALQSKLLSGKAIKMKFAIKGGESVSILAEVGAKRARIETKSMSIVSDGKTVWNYRRLANQVTIDKLSDQSGPLQNPEDLFRFADNYTSELKSSSGNQFTLLLHPSSRIAPLFKQIGGAESITFVLQKSKSGISIKKASIQTSKGAMETGSLTIQSVSKIGTNDFTFKPPSGAKIIDLRD